MSLFKTVCVQLRKAIISINLQKVFLLQQTQKWRILEGHFLIHSQFRTSWIHNSMYPSCWPSAYRPCCPQLPQCMGSCQRCLQAGGQPALGAQPGMERCGFTPCTVVGWLCLSQDGSGQRSRWPMEVTVEWLSSASPQPAAEFVLALLTLAWPWWWPLLPVCLLTWRRGHFFVSMLGFCQDTGNP